MIARQVQGDDQWLFSHSKQVWCFKRNSKKAILRKQILQMLIPKVLSICPGRQQRWCDFTVIPIKTPQVTASKHHPMNILYSPRIHWTGDICLHLGLHVQQQNYSVNTLNQDFESNESARCASTKEQCKSVNIVWCLPISTETDHTDPFTQLLLTQWLCSLRERHFLLPNRLLQPPHQSRSLCMVLEPESSATVSKIV